MLQLCCSFGIFSSVHCEVEHPFHIVKRQFGYAKVAYRGLAKNFNRFNALFVSTNILVCARAGRPSLRKQLSLCVPRRVFLSGFPPVVVLLT